MLSFTRNSLSFQEMIIFERNHAMAVELLTEQHPVVLVSASVLAAVRANCRGLHIEAQTILSSALPKVCVMFGEDAAMTKLVKVLFTYVLLALGHYNEAIDMIDKVVTDAKSLPFVSHFGMHGSCLRAQALAHLGRLAEADAELAPLVEFSADNPRSESDFYAHEILVVLGFVRLLQGRLREARALMLPNARKVASVTGSRHPVALQHRSYEAMLLEREGRKQEALELYAGLLADLRASMGPTHFMTSACETALAQVL